LLSIVYVYPFRCSYCNHRFRSLTWGERYRALAVDQRAFERVGVAIPAAIRDDHGQRDGTIRNFSEAGGLMEVSGEFAIGDLARVEMKPENHLPIVIEVAEVRALRTDAVGLRFVTFETGHDQRLRDLVVSLSVPEAK